MADLLATDLALTAIAERRMVASDDPALRILESWVGAIDAHPVAVDIDPGDVRRQRVAARQCARVIAATAAALVLSSSGIAAAVQGDPLAPLNFMVDKFGGATNDGPPSHGLFGYRGDARQLLIERRQDALDERRASRGGRSDDASKQSEDRQKARLVADRERTEGTDGASANRPSGDSGDLAVRPPRDPGSLERPKPGDGQMPPDRPEQIPTPVDEPWPKPPAELPPPDEPLPSSGDSGPYVG